MKLVPTVTEMNKLTPYFFTLIVFAFSLMLTLPSKAQDIPTEPVGHVNDFANLLSDTERNRIEQDLRNYRDTTTNVITIATVQSLYGFSKEELATKLFNEWQMWHEDRYNGILILIVPSERAIRIETGYGLEGAFPDAVANRVIDEIITPNFRQNQYYKGLNEATTAIRQIISGEFEASPSKTTSSSHNELFEILKVVAFFAFVFFFLFSSRNKRGGSGSRRAHSLGAGGIFIGTGGHRRSSGGGFSGGGFGGFSGGGGFGSGGGGAGGSW